MAKKKVTKKKVTKKKRSKKPSLDQQALIKLVNRSVLLQNKLAPIDADYERKTRKIKEELREIDELLLKYKDEELVGLKTTKGEVKFAPKVVPQIKDFNKFLGYLFRNKMKAADLIPRQVILKACRDRWAEKRAIPGVVPFTVRTVTVKPIK